MPHAPAEPLGRTYELADRVLDGRLADWLLENRAAGVSADRLAKRLYAEHNVDVSRTLIATWLKALQLPETGASEAVAS